MDPITYFLRVFFSAFLVETLVEYLLGLPFDRIEKLNPYKWALVYFSAVFGVGLAVFYRIDILPLTGLEPSIVVQVLTGLLISRGSNFINDLWSRFFPSGVKYDLQDFESGHIAGYGMGYADGRNDELVESGPK